MKRCLTSYVIAAAAAAAKSLYSCPTLCDPMYCSLPRSAVHGIFQARVLEWGAIAFSSYVIKEFQIKTAMKYHQTPIRRAKCQRPALVMVWNNVAGGKATTV